MADWNKRQYVFGEGCARIHRQFQKEKEQTLLAHKRNHVKEAEKQNAGD